ncbi:MAG: S9 family peptidase [Candidatus Sulfotelmatobacter sp.]
MKALICAFALLSFTLSAWAAHPFKVEDMQRLSRVAGPRVSPDGKWVAFTVVRSDVEKNKMVTNIWRVPAAGGDPQQITFAEQGFNGDLRWSPDGRYLYFVSTRVENKRQIFRLSVQGGEAKQITAVPTGVDSFFLSPDGKIIAITATVFPSCTDMACNEKMAKQRADNPVKVRVITDIPFRRWDTWVDGMRNHIFVMPADGGAAKDITPGDVDSPIWTESGSEEVAFSPDSREICFSRYVENEALTGNSDLFVIPVDGGAPKAITTNKSTDSTPLYSPDGRYIAYSATLRPMQETDLTRLFLYDRKTGEHKNIFEATDRSVGSYVWAPDSKSLYVTFEDHGREPLERLDIDTLKLTPLETADAVDGAEVSRDGTFLVFTKTDFSHPADIFRLNLGTSAGSPTPLTQMNAQVLQDIEFGEFSSFTFHGWNGENIQSWEVKPPNFDPNKKYPLLLLMHGGPENSWTNLFHYRWNPQLFAAAGYVVIMPNFHGSSGFGIKFMDAIKGQWGGAPYEDQMKAVDTALTWPYVDTTRIAAAGGSYGGYMANWVEGHTDRFRTLVCHDGLFDIITMFYSSDLAGGVQPEFKGSPWGNQQPLIDQAPSTFAKNFKTPMLIIHGEHDYRVDPSEGYAMFQVLQAMHIPSKLLLFEDENHWVLKPADDIFWYHSVLDWLDEWVKPDRASYEKNLQASRSGN